MMKSYYSREGSLILNILIWVLLTSFGGLVTIAYFFLKGNLLPLMGLIGGVSITYLVLKIRRKMAFLAMTIAALLSFSPNVHFLLRQLETQFWSIGWLLTIINLSAIIGWFVVGLYLTALIHPQQKKDQYYQPPF